MKLNNFTVFYIKLLKVKILVLHILSSSEDPYIVLNFQWNTVKYLLKYGQSSR